MKALCSIENCEKVAHARGWCGTHYRRWKKYSDPLKMLRPNYGSKRRRTPAGYIEVWNPGHPTANGDGYALEHRYVMHELGYDVTGMHVHHLDHDKANNDPANLAVMTPGEHSATHDEPNAGQFKRQTHCNRGHEFTPDNTYTYGDGRRRECYACKRAKSRRTSSAEALVRP